MKPTLTFLLIGSLFLFTYSIKAQTPNLRSVAPFTLFTTTGAVGNTGTSDVNGKVGTNAGAITGFTFDPGQEENGNSVTSLAATDLQTVYNEIYSRPQTFPTHGPILGNGEILDPGVYSIIEAASIEGTLILDAHGNSHAVFIFKIQGAFSPGPGSKISLLNKASYCNIFWVIEGGAVAIAALSEMKGTFIANPGAVSMAATSQLEGRLLSTTGAVAVDGMSIVLPDCSTLPVTLINFSAAKKNYGVELSWIVADEYSFEGYDLERSADGINFNKIAWLPASNTTMTTSYKWVDNEPIMLNNYYRLKMVNLDAGFKYSGILKISLITKMQFLIYPNPVTDRNLSLQINGQSQGEARMNIYNQLGVQVMIRKLQIGANDAVINIPIDKDLLPGFYILELIDVEGKKQSLKFILN